MPDAISDLSELAATLRDGIDAGLHLGAQVYASIEAETVAWFAVGEARDGVPLTTDHLMLWMSGGKPFTAIAVAQLVESGELDWDDPVSQWLPGLDGERRGITLDHLLQHTSGLVEPDLTGRFADWHEALAVALDAPLREGAAPGTSAAYSPLAAWHLLGAVVERVVSMPLSEYVRDAVLRPCGADDAYVGIPPKRYDALAARLSTMHNTARRPGDDQTPRPLHYAQRGWATQPRPGSNTYATAAAVGAVYETLLHGGTPPRGGERVLTPDSVAALVTRRREGMMDATFRHVVDFGRGFVVNSYHHGPDTVPYGFGAAASRETFGHSGNQSAVAFADPTTRLVVAIACNGMPGEPRHQRRARAWLAALERDLGQA